jgi:hypothetical protein
MQVHLHQFVYKTNPESALDLGGLLHDSGDFTKAQQQTLVRLADWVVSDVVEYARARRQRERRRFLLCDVIWMTRSQRSLFLEYYGSHILMQ